VLDTGAKVTATINGSVLTFAYSVAAGQTSPDLDALQLFVPPGSTLRDASGNDAILTLPATKLASMTSYIVNPLPPTTVSLITINTGQPQRSRLTQIQLQFAVPVNTALLTDVSVVRSDGVTVRTGGSSGRVIVSPTMGLVSSATLTFENAFAAPVSDGVEYGSLSDGRWRVVIPYLSFVSLDFHRLFGDINGDATVDGGSDFSAFGSEFGLSLVGSPFDFNADGVIDGGTDFAAFGERFGQSVP